MILISQYGGFHGLQGALAAHRLGRLQYYISNLPPVKTLPVSKQITLRWRLNLPNLVFRKLYNYSHQEFFNSLSDKFILSGREKFTRITRAYISSETTIFHAYSAFQELCWDRCDQLGVKKIIDWGIAHPDFLNQILSGESRLLHVPFPKMTDSKRVLKELHRVDYVIIPSSFVRNTFLEKGFPGEKLITIPYGVNLNQFYPRPRVSTSDVFNVATAGIIGLRKGTQYLMKSVRELVRDGLPVKLFLFGDPESNMTGILKEYQDVITYCGGMSQQHLSRELAKMDVFVLPSLAEGMARVILEAMACGVPCIVTENCGYHPMIQDGINGFIIPIRNSQAIADKLAFLYSHPDIRAKIARNALRSAKQHSWDTYWNKLQDLYNKFQ